MTSPTPLPEPASGLAHPVVWFAGRAHEVLDEVLAAGLHVASLDPAATATTIAELTRLAARVEALAMSLLPHADTVQVAAAATPVATSTDSWYAHATRIPSGAAHRAVKTAKRLDGPYQRSRDAALAGDLHTAQREVIVTALDGLPAWVTAEQRVRAEQHLIGLAAQHDAKELKILARHLLHVIDPDAAEDELARRLAAEETDAARRTTLKLFDDGNGTCHGTFRIPTLHGAMLITALNALLSPRRPDPIAREAIVPDAGGHGLVQRTAPELLGHAFCELLERYPAKKVPRTGGGLATVLVTIPLTTLETGLGIATISTGGHLSAGAARRLACHAGIIPQVLGTRSEVLDQGRRTRLHTEPQRIALATRDRGCTAEGCTIPAAWCHAHHDIPWSQGGPTTVADGRLLCPRHHTLVHRPDHRHACLPNGKIRITRHRPDRQ